MNNLKVYTSPLPFSNKQTAITVPLGASIQDIVNAAMPAHLRGAGVLGAVAMINGEVIPREYWPRVRPKAGHHNIAVRIVPTGGKKGGKNPIASILSIAVLIAAPYVAGAILGPALAATQIGIGTLTYGGLLSSAIGIVGRLAISALAPPPKPSNAGSGGNSVSNATESPTQFIEGAKNSLVPFGVVPVNLGTNRMFPLQAARPFTESQSNDQYVRQLFTYGYGPSVVIGDLKIGETSLEEFQNFEMEHRLNGDLHEGTNLFPNDAYQDDFSVLLEQSAGFTTRTTQPDVDEVVVDLTFPNGLCQYTAQGQRIGMRVQLELQYAKTGESPQIWSPAASAYTPFSGTVIAVPAVPYTGETTGGIYFGAFGNTRNDSVYIDKYTGIISYVQGQYGFTGAQPIPGNGILLATVEVKTDKNPGTGVLSTNITVYDARQASLFGTNFEDSGDFVPSKTGAQQITISGGSLLVNDLDLFSGQKEALIKSQRIVFPERGQYDIRVRRLTPDSFSDQIFDKAYLTAIKSFKNDSPVNLVGINGTAMRIRATDQLNGALDQFNVVISTVIPDYDSVLDAWVPRITSNPASIYRYVLQGLPNGKRLADSKILIEDLEEWHRYCVQEGYSYNRVIDYETSVDEVLRDVAAAGAASPAIVDGKRTVAVDMPKDDIVQIITPRNSWGYSGEMIYPDLPHAFRVQFRNSDKGFIQDERVVYDDGFDATNALKYEVLELQSCTFSDFAFKTGRRHIAAARLRPEMHTWMMDVENLVAIRGNRVKLEHDAPIIGVGDGRVKLVNLDSSSPQLVTGFTIDDTVTIPNDGTYYVRIRLADGTQLYKELITIVGATNEFTFRVPFLASNAPAPGDLCYFVEAGGEVDLIITRIEPQDDLAARLTGIDYAQPQIKNAENAAIPAFDSKITTPLEFIRPEPPILLTQQSDESVMLVNSDGTFTPRAVFTLQNNNEGEVEIYAKLRLTGTTEFSNPNVLERSPERLVLTGMEDGRKYDLQIRYRRRGSTVYSRPLELNGYTFIGASGKPDNVTGFKINVVDSSALLKWDANDDIDLSHYEVRFAPQFFGATWGTALVLEERVYDNRVTVPFLGGTYFVKAVDLTLNASEDAAVIITYDPGLVENAVAILEEHPDFSGTKDNAMVLENRLYLADASLGVGYYYFENDLDLTGVFTSFVSASIIANGAFINNLFDVDDIFAMPDVFGAGVNDVFAMADIFAEEDIFGIGNDAWQLVLEYRTTQTDPGNSPVVWSDWEVLEAGTIEFWGIQFRLKMLTFTQNVSPAVLELAVRVDMPDRIERGEDMLCPVAGAVVNFTPHFKQSPAIAITIQDADEADEIQFVSKGVDGFEFKIYNRTLSVYVERTYDFIASGFGRKSV